MVVKKISHDVVEAHGLSRWPNEQRVEVFVFTPRVLSQFPVRKEAVDNKGQKVAKYSNSINMSVPRVLILRVVQPRGYWAGDGEWWKVVKSSEA